jgi:hypothetical protein
MSEVIGAFLRAECGHKRADWASQYSSEAVNTVYVAEMYNHAASATFTRKSRLGIETNRHYVEQYQRLRKPTPQPLVCSSASIVVSSVVARTIVTAIRIVRTMVAVVAAVSVSAVSSAPIHSPVDARDTERREGPSDSSLRTVDGQVRSLCWRPMQRNRSCTQKRGADHHAKRTQLFHDVSPW